MITLDKTKVVRNLGKKYKLVPYLEKAIATFDEPWQFVYEEKELDHHWHPSSHCTEPVTWLYEVAAGTREGGIEDISSVLRKSFQVGHFWHQWLQYIVVEKLHFATHDDIECKMIKSWGDGPYHAVAGSADISPCQTPSWTGGIDFKTMSAQQFKQAGIPEWAAAKYECQVNIYMDLFDQDEWIIVPINKDTPHDFKEFLYRRNQSLIDAIYGKWEFVAACVDADEPPTKMDDEMFPLPLTGPIST